MAIFTAFIQPAAVIREHDGGSYHRAKSYGVHAIGAAMTTTDADDATILTIGRRWLRPGGRFRG
jgi:hypothetical protein